jgi:hypothetical protein
MRLKHEDTKVPTHFNGFLHQQKSAVGTKSRCIKAEGMFPFISLSFKQNNVSGKS